MSLRRTKIVATIGPASESPTVLEQLILAGMDVARLNFSHGTYEEHAARIENIRAASDKAGRHVAILMDIQGPKIRIGDIEGGSRELHEGEIVFLTPDPALQGPDTLYVGYPPILTDLQQGSVIYLDDGLLELVVDGIEGDR